MSSEEDPEERRTRALYEPLSIDNKLKVAAGLLADADDRRQLGGVSPREQYERCKVVVMIVESALAELRVMLSRLSIAAALSKLGGE